MTREFEVGIKLTADGKSLVGETRAAKEALGGLGDTARKTGSDLGNTSNKTDGLTVSTNNLKLGLIAATGVVASYFAAMGGADALIDAAIANERFNNSLTIGLGSQDAAQAEMAILREESNRLGLELENTASQYAKLTVSARGTKLEGQAVRDIFIGVAQASTVLGMSAADTGGVLLAVEQMISKGKVSAEELRGQMGERLPGAFQMAARAIGVTTAELDEMLARGEITAEQLLPALARELNATFGPQAEQAAQGLNAQINRFNTALFDLKVAIGETGLIDFLSDGIQLATRLTNAMAGVFGANANLSAIDQQKQKVTELKATIDSIYESRRVSLAGEFHTLLPFTTTDRELHDLEAKLEGATEDLYKMAIAANEVAKADTQVAASTNTLSEALKKRGKEIADSVISPTEKYRAAQEDLNKLLSAGAISQETYNRALAKAGEEYAKATTPARALISESTRFIQSLTKEVESIGKDANELKRLEAAKLGVLEVAEPLIDALEAETRALEDQAKATRQREEDLRLIAQVTESVATGEEKYAARVQELDRLLSAGMGQETYNRALKQAEEQFLKTGKAGRDAFDEISQFSIQAQRNLQNALGDAFFDGIQGNFDAMVDGFERAIEQMLAQALAADIWGTLFNKPTGNMAALFNSFGLTGSTAASGGTSGIGILDVANIGTGLSNFSKSAMEGFGVPAMLGRGLTSVAGSGLTGSFGAGMAGGSEAAAFIAAESATAGAGLAASAGSAFAAAAGPLAIAAAATAILRSIAGDKRMGGGFGDALNLMGDIPILGDFMPVVPLMNVLFGRGSLEQKETNLIGDITASGFSGITSTKFKAEGGLAVSDKIDRVMTDTDSGELLNQYRELVESGISDELQPFAEQARSYSLELGKFLDDSITGISNSVRSMADMLGIGQDALDNFSMGINIASEKEQALTDEQIGQVITDASDAMARTLIPTIDSLSKNGESAYQTLQRVSLEFDVLSALGLALGNSLDGTKSFLQDMSFEDRSAFIEQAGGVDELASNAAFFAQNFLTPDEQIAPVIEQVKGKLRELGLEAIQTREQFAEVVQSFGHVNGISKETLIALLDLAPAFLQTANASEQITNTTENQTAVLTSLGTVLGNSTAATKVYLQSVSAADQATFIEQADGSDVLAQNIAAYSQNFLTPEEQLAPLKEHVANTLKELGLEGIKTKEQFKELIHSFGQVNGISGETTLALLGIAGDFAQVADAAQQSEANIDQNMLSLAQNFAPDEVLGIKYAMMSEALAQFGISADISKEKLTEYLKEFVRSGGLYTAMADEVMNAANIALDYLNTLDQLNLDEVNDAYSALQRSVDAERTRLTNEYNTALDGINTQIENVTDSIGKLKSLSDALKTTVNDIRPMERSDAKAQIEAALNTARSGGELPDVEDIRDALDVLKEQSTSGFTSSFDYAFEQAKTASMLGELGALTDDQLSIEESTLSALEGSRDALTDGFEAEILRLDSILEDAQAQIDLLTGIEANTKSIAEALANFQVAISNAVGGGSFGSFSGVSNAEVAAYIAAHPDYMDQYNAAIANGVTALQYSQVTGIPVSAFNTFTSDNGLAPLERGFDQNDVNNYFQNYGGNNEQAAKDAFQYGATASEIAKATGYSIDEINAYTESLGLGRLSQYSEGGFTGPGGKYDPAGIVHAGEFVFNQEAVKNLGVGTLEQLHESAERGEPEGYATGGLVGAQNIINRSDVSRINSITDESVIDARSLFAKRIASNDITRELMKERESIRDIANIEYVLHTLNEANSVGTLENVINAKHIFEKRAASRNVNRELSTQSNIIRDVINAAYTQSTSVRDITRVGEKNTLNIAQSSDEFTNFTDFEKSIDRISEHTLSPDSNRSMFNGEIVRELQRAELTRGFASGGYTGNADIDEPAGIVHGREYVFSAPAVGNIGLNTLESLHESAKDGRPFGCADGGFVSGDISPIPRAEIIKHNSIAHNNDQPGTQNQQDVIAELRLLREEMKNARMEMEKVREYNRRMSNKFDAVTQGGTAFRTKTA